jgi:hypothetical protein
VTHRPEYCPILSLPVRPSPRSFRNVEKWWWSLLADSDLESRSSQSNRIRYSPPLGGRSYTYTYTYWGQKSSEPPSHLREY